MKTRSLLFPLMLLMVIAAAPTASGAAKTDKAGAVKAKAAKTAKKARTPVGGDFKLTDPNVVQRQEAYKKLADGSELKIDIFEPKNKEAGRQYPAIVFFFGGGWVGGSPSQFYRHCEYLAGRGMIAMSAQYRTATSHKATPAECVKDGKSAVRWVRANAQRLGVDPQRIAAGGGSAGGHVAAAVGNCPGFEEEGEDAKVSCRPNALVLFNPVFDNGPTGYGYDRVKSIFPAISPLHNLKAGAPPTIVFLGTQDNLIPVATAKDYQAKMEKNGGRCDLKLYEGQAHGFFNYRGEEHKYYTETLIEADKFLASLGWIKGEPTLK